MQAPEPIAQALRSHQVKVATDWAHRGRVADLHEMVAPILTHFDIAVPQPVVIAVARLRHTRLAQYTYGRSELGIRTTITFNAAYLAARPWPDTVVTLLHELLHGWDEYAHGIVSGCRWHTRTWQRRAEDCGLIADRRGHTLRITPELRGWLLGMGADDASAIPTGDEPATADLPVVTPGRAMPRWRCSCRAGHPVRASYLHAACLDCGGVFHTD